MKIKIPGLYVERQAAQDVADKKRKGLHANTDTDFFAHPVPAELDVEMPNKAETVKTEEVKKK